MWELDRATFSDTRMSEPTYVDFSGVSYPFRIDPARPESFGLEPDEIAGRVVLDVGCGPISRALCLVHCAEVHAVDPLLDHYRRLQPFGWRSFASVHVCGAEALILLEISRVLRPEGSFLLYCDLRERGGGPAHPYRWDRDGG